MQYLRLTARPPLEEMPRTFRVLVASEHVDRVRWVSWNLTDSRGLTVLFHVDGHREPVRTSLDDAPEVVAADVTPIHDGTFYLLATLDPTYSAITAAVYRIVRQDGVVLLPPVAERDGVVEIQLVGEAAGVQAVLDAIPESVSVSVNEVGTRGLVREDPGAVLSGRQREAVMAALDLGYYAQARDATHADVADAIGCAPSTASEHLKKAEAKLVRAVLADEE